MSDSHAADVQAELQQYLNSKNINSLFISIVENLLIEKPANPIGFMIEYLYKQFPDQAKDTIEALSTPIAPAAVAATPAAAAAAPSADPVEDDSEDDEDDVGDMPEVAAPKPRPKDRRSSVSAESMDPSKLKAQMSQVTNIPKEPEVAAALLHVVGRSPLLRSLDTEQKDMLVKAFSGPVVKQNGEDIIVQGDTVNNDTFYLLEEGSVDVYITKKGEEETKVHTYKPGDSFGELAIMYNAPRAATCRVSGEAKLWVLDRLSFKIIVVAASMQKREKYQNFLSQVEILSSLNEMEVMTLADSLAEETFQDQSIIMTQGEEGNHFYIILDGTAEISKTDSAGVSQHLGTRTVGDYFGEIALMSSKPRQATIKAVGVLKLLVIDRSTFVRVLGSLEDIMQRNMGLYSKVAASI